jgi:uncharacterized protein (DUF58 family)
VTGRWWLSFATALLLLSIPMRHGLLLVLSLVLLLTAALSTLWARRCLVALEYRRRFSARRAFWGEEVELTIEVVNRKLLPLAWLETDDELPAELSPTRGNVVRTHHRARSRLLNVLALRPYERVRRHYRLPCNARGEHAFGPARFRSGDPFGFREVESRLDEPDYLLVYPRIVALDRLGLPTRDPFGDRPTRSWLFEDPLRIVGTRDYAPGDTPRRIHWPASARTGRLQVKQYQPTTSQRLMVLLNVNTLGPAWWAQGYDPDLLELAIMTAASICTWADGRGYQVGLAANATQRRVGGRLRVPAGRDPEHLGRMLEALARAQPIAMAPLAALLRDEARAAAYGTTFVVVAARLDEDALGELGRLGAAALILIGERAPAVAPRGVAVHRVVPSESWRDLPALDLA